jgi:hypothetical protein
MASSSASVLGGGRSCQCRPFLSLPWALWSQSLPASPAWLTVSLATVLLIALGLSGSYRRIERVAIAFGLFEIAFLPAAIMAHPNLGSIATTFLPFLLLTTTISSSWQRTLGPLSCPGCGFFRWHFRQIAYQPCMGLRAQCCHLSCPCVRLSERQGNAS